MRYLLIAVAAILVGSCASHTPQTKNTTQTRVVTVVKTVKAPKAKKCIVAKPVRPKSLPDTLPFESPKTLIDILTNKLNEWAGPGGYGDKVEKAINVCNRS